MKIIEKQNKNDLEISKVKINADHLLHDSKGRLPPLPLIQRGGFCSVIAGFSGSGKTSLLINLLTKKNSKKQKRSYRGCFDKIVFVSPSAHTIGNTEIQNLENKHTELDSIIIDEIIESIENNKNSDEYEDGYNPQYLIIFDDVGVYLRNDKRLEAKINVLVANRRHYGISLFFLVQNIMQLPPPVRKNLSCLFLYKPKNQVEKELIRKEYVDANCYEFQQLLDYVYQDKHDFLLIDCSLRNSADIEFYRNFNKLEFRPEVDLENAICKTAIDEIEN